MHRIDHHLRYFEVRRVLILNCNQVQEVLLEEKQLMMRRRDIMGLDLQQVDLL